MTRNSSSPARRDAIPQGQKGGDPRLDPDGVLGLILVSVLLRPKSPPNLMADSLASLGSLFLLTPGVQALLKLRQKEEKSGE